MAATRREWLAALQRWQHCEELSLYPALQSVLAGDTKVIFMMPSVQMMEFIKQGKLKVIGVTSAQPSPAVPGAVPLNKFVPGFVQDINFALWAPPGTPADGAPNGAPDRADWAHRTSRATVMTAPRSR